MSKRSTTAQRVTSVLLERRGGTVNWENAEKAFWAFPSFTDVIGVLGVIVAIFAAFSARTKAEAVRKSVSNTTQKIATAHLREAFDALRRLAGSLDQAIQDEDKHGARYVLVWIAQESARCVALLPRTGIADTSRSGGSEPLTELLGRLSTASLDAKSKLYSSDQRAKLSTVTRGVKQDLDTLSLDLVTITTHIGYGMDVNDVQ